MSGEMSFQKLMDATGLSRRGLEHGREMRTAFDCETAKAVAEIPADEGVSENAQVDSNDDEDSEADTVYYSNDDGDHSDENNNDMNINNDQDDTT